MGITTITISQDFQKPHPHPSQGTKKREENPHLRPHQGPKEPGSAVGPGPRLRVLYLLSLPRHTTTNTLRLLPPPQPASFGPPFSPGLLSWGQHTGFWTLWMHPHSQAREQCLRRRPGALHSGWRGHLHMNCHPISLL